MFKRLTALAILALAVCGCGGQRANSDGLDADGALAALESAGVYLPDPRDNTETNCGGEPGDCIRWITTDAVTVLEYPDEESAIAADRDHVAGRLALQFNSKLSDNHFPHPNKWSYEKALDAYVASEPIPEADPSLGMPGANGCQLASEAFWDQMERFRKEGRRASVVRIYYAPFDDGHWLVTGRITGDNDIGVWLSTSDPGIDQVPDEIFSVTAPARLHSLFQADRSIESAIQSDGVLAAKLAECSMME